MVSVKHGQKTGAYLDQRDNRLLLSRFTAGKRVLDAFSYNGGFGVYASALGGAAHVLCVDSSPRAVETIQANVDANGASNVEARQGKVAEILRSLKGKGEPFDVVVLDPPKFVRSRSGLNRGRKAYREINLLAMQVISDGGLLLSCSCSPPPPPPPSTWTTTRSPAR